MDLRRRRRKKKTKATADDSLRLWEASLGGRLDEVRSLLDLDGLDIHYSDKDGCTSLFVASQMGHIDVVKVLIKAGCIVNQADDDGRTPLYAASSDGNVDIVNVLIDAGGNVNQATTDDGHSPLFIAVQLNHQDIVQQLLSTPNININQSIRKSQKDFVKK